MGFFSTAVSALTGGVGTLTSGVSNLATQFSGLLAATAPIAQLGSQLGLFGSPAAPTPAIATGPTGPTMPMAPTRGAVALPGGARIVGQHSTSPLMLSAALGPTPSVAGQGGACIFPTASTSVRMPHQVTVPNGRGGFDTYIKAPKAIFKVTVRGRRRGKR